MTLRIAVLGSTRGSNLEPLFRLLHTAQVDAQIELVLSDRAQALILAGAKDLGIASQFVCPQGLSRVAYGEQLTQILQKKQIDLVILIGFMRILSADFTQQWVGKVLNVHPSLLPKYAGLMDRQVHEAVIAAGDSESGCTVHQVEAQVDAGKILVQKICEVTADDTPESLKAKVQKLEVLALLEAIEGTQLQSLSLR